jgi:hypothetical protein
MGTYRRVNVVVGGPVAQLAHSSRALRVGNMVFQSRTTAIDRQENIHGEGDLTK